MKDQIGESKSIWKNRAVQMPECESLKISLDTDVCIIGAGFGGLTTAYLLAKAGKKVVVLEDGEIGSGQSGRTTAQLTTALDGRYSSIERLHGEKGAFFAAQSHQTALNKVSEIVHSEKIDCDFERVDAYLFAGDNRQRDLLYNELDAVHRAGLSEVFMMPSAPVTSFDTGPCLKFPQQIQLNPVKYLAGLARLIQQNGGKIFTGTHVVEMQSGPKAFVKTRSGHTVRADSLVVATNSPINDLLAIHTKQAAYRTYVIGIRAPKAISPDAFLYDTDEPYHYLRMEGDTLLVGGEDHKTGQNTEPEECYRRLENWARKKFPFAEDVQYRWSGQVLEPIDGIAFLGHNPMDRKNVYVITGTSGNGTTHCTIGAMLIHDQILGVQNPWEALYDPSRIVMRAFGRFVKETSNMMIQYKDWFTGKDFEAVDEIRQGEGVVVRRGLEKIAAYKDEYGSLHLHSAVCPHLGGIVRWNSAEKSWDCPCHGSRFSCKGEVLEGPALNDLRKIDQIENDVLGQPLLVDEKNVPRKQPQIVPLLEG